MNFKSLFINITSATALAIGAVGLGGGSAAEAATHECYWTTENTHVCVYNVRGNDYYRTFDMDVNGRYAGNHGVQCNPAHRYNYVENAYGIACFQFD